jgi:hypothetical protein
MCNNFAIILIAEDAMCILKLLLLFFFLLQIDTICNILALIHTRGRHLY